MASYFDVHLRQNKFRSDTWKEISRYLDRFIISRNSLLELGPGYCDFVNNANFTTKYVIDSSEDVRALADPTVKVLISDLDNVNEFPAELDLVLCSNIFEHLPLDVFERTLNKISAALSEDGLLIVIQPNFKYAFKTYFDDFTHQTIFTDMSLASHLRANGFEIVKIKPKFLPYSMRNISPLIPSILIRFLVRTYLWSPIRIKSGQMLIIAKNKEIIS
jgi:hypothetical protein